MLSTNKKLKMPVDPDKMTPLDLQKFLFFLFIELMLYIPVIYLSVMSGTFPGLNQY